MTGFRRLRTYVRGVEVVWGTLLSAIPG